MTNHNTRPGGFTIVQHTTKENFRMHLLRCPECSADFTWPDDTRPVCKNCLYGSEHYGDGATLGEPLASRIRAKNRLQERRSTMSVNEPTPEGQVELSGWSVEPPTTLFQTPRRESAIECTRIAAPNDVTVAVTFPGTDPKGNVARLIAAAPELRDALERLVRVYTDHDAPAQELTRAVEQAQAALEAAGVNDS